MFDSRLRPNARPAAAGRRRWRTSPARRPVRRPLMLRLRQPLLQPSLLVGRQPQQPLSMLPPHPQHPQQPHHHHYHYDRWQARRPSEAVSVISAPPRGASEVASEAIPNHWFTAFEESWKGPSKNLISSVSLTFEEKWLYVVGLFVS